MPSYGKIYEVREFLRSWRIPWKHWEIIRYTKLEGVMRDYDKNIICVPRQDLLVRIKCL